jgi:hypothetical protein
MYGYINILINKFKYFAINIISLFPLVAYMSLFLQPYSPSAPDISFFYHFSFFDLILKLTGETLKFQPHSGHFSHLMKISHTKKAK